MRLAFLAAANSIHGIRWVDYFARRGHAVTWISLAPPGAEAEEVAPRTHFHEITPSPLTDVSGRFAIRHLGKAARRVKEILRESAPEILHVHSAGTYGMVGTKSGFHPLVLTPWGSDVLLGSTFREFALRKIVRSADALTCDGENTKARLIELGAKPETISLIRFGVEIEKFAVPRIPHRGIAVISLRTLIPVYDVKTLVRAAALAKRSMPDLRVIIAGEGSERSSLEACARELGIQDSVAFTGRYRPENLPEMFAGADIYASTSLSDSGLSASTAEAMAAGLPVVVSDSGDNRDWVEEGAGGHVVPCGDAEMFAHKIAALAKDPHMRAAFGLRNRAIIKERNDYAREMEKMEKLYAEVIANHKKDRG